MRCKNCSAELPSENSRFCQICGAQQKIVKKQKSKAAASTVIKKVFAILAGRCMSFQKVNLLRLIPTHSA